MYCCTISSYIVQHKFVTNECTYVTICLLDLTLAATQIIPAKHENTHVI